MSSSTSRKISLKTSLQKVGGDKQSRRQFYDAKRVGRSGLFDFFHAVGVLDGRKGTLTHFTCIGFRCACDLRTKCRKFLNEFRGLGRETQHVFKHQDLTVAIW